MLQLVLLLRPLGSVVTLFEGGRGQREFREPNESKLKSCRNDRNFDCQKSGRLLCLVSAEIKGHLEDEQDWRIIRNGTRKSGSVARAVFILFRIGTSVGLL